MFGMPYMTQLARELGPDKDVTIGRSGDSAVEQSATGVVVFIRRLITRAVTGELPPGPADMSNYPDELDVGALGPVINGVPPAPIERTMGGEL